MKKQLLTAFIALATCSVNAQWIQQTVPFGYEGYINDIRITDVNTVWGNTWDAVLHSVPYTQDWVRTTDGGNVWTTGTIGAPSANVISNIWPIDADTCYAAMFDSTGAGGVVYKTTNGGAAWSQVGANMFQAPTSFANVVYFWDAQNGVAMGDPIGSPLKYEIHLTNDYGNTWTQVPPANIPVLANTAEYGITNLFDAADGRIWFATTYGDVYRSIDGGNNWTKSASGFPAYIPAGGSRQDISNIAFSDSLHGLLMQVNGNTLTISLRSTSDGGLTWSPVSPVGTVFGGSICGVPGTVSTFVSSGSNPDFGFGTSFTLDGGQNWIEIDNGISHTHLDFLDTITGWTGEYIQAGAIGGAWKFDGVLVAVSCTSPNINPGVSSANDSSICFNDTLTVTTTGVVAPTEGATHGFSIIVSTADISGNNDPLSDPSIVGGTGIIVGTPPPTVLVNDQQIFAPGMYYFTPVVYGNATGSGNVTALTLDPNCTFTGTSVYVNLLDLGDLQCTVGISDFAPVQFTVNAYLSSGDVLNVRIRALKNDDGSAFEIFDLTGRKVFSSRHSLLQGLNEFSVNVGGLSAGTYILKSESSGAVATNRLVKF
jgi:hypothetical protein